MNRLDRIADIDWVEWLSAEVLPDEKLWAVVCESRQAQRNGPPDSTGLKRVVFNGRYWMTRDAFSFWQPVPRTEEPVTALISKSKDGKPIVIDGLSLVEYDKPKALEFAALAQLSKLELNVNLVRVYQPQENATGAMSGKILAVSKGYAAQSIGGNGVVFHEQSKLSRTLSPGENVTLDYKEGKATVYNGCFYDVEISSNLLDAQQRGWLRMNMIEALSSVEGAENDDVMIREALHYAIDKTMGMYEDLRGNLTSSEINLTVQDIMPKLQMDVADRTGHYVDRDALELDQTDQSRRIRDV